MDLIGYKERFNNYSHLIEQEVEKTLFELKIKSKRLKSNKSLDSLKSKMKEYFMECKSSLQLIQNSLDQMMPKKFASLLAQKILKQRHQFSLQNEIDTLFKELQIDPSVCPKILIEEFSQPDIVLQKYKSILSEYNFEQIIYILESYEIISPETSKKHLIYFVPQSEQVNQIGALKMYAYEENSSPDCAICKTILVVGESGSGKTSLINSFVNLSEEVEYHRWRYSLKTTNFEINKINYPKIGLTLKLIDTPGFFGFSEKEDEQIIEEFKQLFLRIQSIDEIIIVSKATITSVNPNISQVHSRIQEIFGKDMLKRLNLFCSFADNQKPKAAEVLKNIIPFEEVYGVNTQWLECNDKDNMICRCFYDMTKKSSFQYLDNIIKKNESSMSLNSSIQVLNWRKNQKDIIEQSINKRAECLSEIQIFNQNIEAKEKADIQQRQNQNYEVDDQVEIVKFQQVAAGKVTQQCTVCCQPCCNVCEWPANEPYSICTYFNNNQNCPKCPGKCPRNVHVRTSGFMQVREKVVQKRVITYMKQEYDDAVQKSLIQSTKIQVSITTIQTYFTTFEKQKDQFLGIQKSLNEYALKSTAFQQSSFFSDNFMDEFSEVKKLILKYSIKSS